MKQTKPCCLRVAVWVLGVLPGVVSVAAGTTWNVPGNYPTIAQAVSAASDNDTIQITDAVHTECGITIGKSLTIQGQGMNSTVVQAATARSNATTRIFYVNAARNVLFKDMTLQYGFVTNAAQYAYGGAAIYNNVGTVTVQNCAITMNDSYLNYGTAGGSGGGALVQANTSTFLTISNCVVSSNTVSGGTGVAGGALFAAGGGLRIIGSTFLANSSVGNGGAMDVGSVNPCSFYNSTFAGNQSTGSGKAGGVLYNSGVSVTVTVYNCTFCTNSANYGGAIDASGPMDICSTIIANNSGGEFYGGTYITMSNSLVKGTYSGALKAGTNNLFSLDPKLNALACNGGPTPTFALQATSPCTNTGFNILGLAYDQRGPGFPRVRGTAADIGAFEYGTGQLTYSRGGFAEKMPDNLGAIDNSTPLLIFLTCDTFTGTDGSQLTNNVVISNLPAGLTVSMVRSNNGATAVVTLLGTATQSAASNTIGNLGFAFKDSAFTLLPASQIINASETNLTVQFFNIPTGLLTYSAMTFNEDPNWQDGRIDNSTPVQVVITGNDSFAGTNSQEFVASGWVVATNVPLGLTAAVTRASGTAVQVTLAGNAVSNAAANSVTNFGLTFLNAAFLGNTASAITNAAVTNLHIAFINTGGAALTYSSMIFYDPIAFVSYSQYLNTGSIGTTNIIALTGAVFGGTNGEDFVASGRVLASNVPSGLTAVITRQDNQRLTATLTGNAAAYASYNDVTNLTFAFQNSAFTNAVAAAVTNATKSNLVIFFSGGMAGNMAVTAVQNTPLNFFLNVWDAEEPAAQMFCKIVNNPAHGTMTWQDAEDGNTNVYAVIYTPNTGFTGMDTFTFQCINIKITPLDPVPFVWSQIATCTVTVISNTIPLAFNQSLQVDPARTSAVFTVSWSDPDAARGQTMTFQFTSLPANGTLATNNIGSMLQDFPTYGVFQYIPNNNFTGNDSFAWQVTDGFATSAVATCTLIVAPTQPPGPAQVLVLYNASYTGDENANGVQDSLEVAQYYCAQRGIPTNNLLGLNCSASDWYQTNQWANFINEIVTPVQNKLAALGSNNVVLLVFSYMTPYSIAVPDGSYPAVSLDTMMALPSYWNMNNGNDKNMSFYNPMLLRTPGFVSDPSHFVPGQNTYSASQLSGQGTPIYLVGRLDGPGGVNRALDYVDQALYAERYAYPTNGAFAGPGTGPAAGNVYVDSESRLWGVPTDAILATNIYVQEGYYDIIVVGYQPDLYSAADFNIAWTEHYVWQSGFQLKWERSSASIGSTNGLVYQDGTSATNAPRAFMYGGWYNANTYYDVWDWLPGSVANDLNSLSFGYTGFRSSTTLNWGIQALRHGASCAMGSLYEPNTPGAPRPNILVYGMLHGYTFAEASMFANPMLAWEGCAVGDPMYRPFWPGKPLVYDTQVPAISTGYPYLSTNLASGVQLNSLVNSTTGLPMVAKAVVQWGTTAACTNPPIAVEGFFRRHKISFPTLDGSTTYHYRLSLTSPVGIAITNVDSTFVSPAESAYTNALVVPGIVRVQYFDNGGEGVGYHGMGYASGLTWFRGTTGLNMYNTFSNLGYFSSLGYAAYIYNPPAGTWMRYTLNIASNAACTLQVCSGNFGGPGGGTCHLEQDGVNVSGPIALNTSGGTSYDTWVITTVSNVVLSAGQHVLRLVCDTTCGPLNYMNFTVQNLAPVATVAMTPASGNGTVPFNVQFSAAASYDPDGSIVSYGWTFGDGGNAAGSLTNHVYTVAGTYRAVLTVTDNNGLTGTASAVVHVGPRTSVLILR